MDEMRAYDYAKTLTDKQRKAFNALLDTIKRESGYYQRNTEAFQADQIIYSEGLKRHASEFQEINRVLFEKEQQIKQEREALRQREAEAQSEAEAARNLIYDLMFNEDKEKREAIKAERGNSAAELEAIERLAIAQYKKRLEKKGKVSA